mmetsp:Transcript_50953/g.141022  ORF Transcript_50953/g.141022 Transcript_50953/m.141022 type:complete len:259 (-) Transcript_50953:12-788(-)
MPDPPSTRERLQAWRAANSAAATANEWGVPALFAARAEIGGWSARSVREGGEGAPPHVKWRALAAAKGKLTIVRTGVLTCAVMPPAGGAQWLQHTSGGRAQAAVATCGRGGAPLAAAGRAAAAGVVPVDAADGRRVEARGQGRRQGVSRERRGKSRLFRGRRAGQRVEGCVRSLHGRWLEAALSVLDSRGAWGRCAMRQRWPGRSAGGGFSCGLCGCCLDSGAGRNIVVPVRAFGHGCGADVPQARVAHQVSFLRFAL